MSQPLSLDNFDALKLSSKLLEEYLRKEEVENFGNKINRFEQSKCDQFYIARNLEYDTIGGLDDHGVTIKYDEFIMFPEEISDEIDKVKCDLFMGLIPEIHCAWIAVDERLYLWNFKKNDITRYNRSHQILSVALSAPKVNVFQSEVKYVLVVATTEDIVLLAVTEDPYSQTWKLIPTPYQTSTDDVIIRKIIGSQTGRIYMGGHNGSLYELEYDNVDSSWGALISDSDSQPRKCVKRTHWNLNIMDLIGSIFSSNNSKFGDICIDDVRNLLYVITEDGILDMYYTGVDGNDTFSPFFNTSRVKQVNIFTLAKTFVKECSHSLKEISPTETDFDENKEVIGIYVIPIIEYKDCHVMILLKSGIRLYCVVFDNVDKIYMGYENNLSPCPPPCEIKIVYIRPPPPSEMIDKTNMANKTCMKQYAKYDRKNNLKKVTHAYYSNGIFITATSNKLNQGKDALIAITDDIICRGNSHDSDRPPSFREGVNLINNDSKRRYIGNVQDIKESVDSIHALEASKMLSLFYTSKTPGDNDMSNISHHAPCFDGTKTVGSLLGNGMEVSESPLSLTPAISPSDMTPGIGINKKNLRNIVNLNGELSLQHVPFNYSLQRKILCLSGPSLSAASKPSTDIICNKGGLHVMSKLRPVDYLFEILCKKNEIDITNFFRYYGSLQACAMCFGIVCGIPNDLGFSNSVLFKNFIKKIPDDIKEEARNYGFKETKEFGGEPRFFTKHNNNQMSSDRILYSCSVSHNALVLLASRILRPIWLRPIVEANQTLICEIWTRPLIHSIREPLINLLALLKSIPMSPKRMIPAGGINNNFIIDAIVKKNSVKPNANEENKKKSKLDQEASIERLILLINRSIEALSLLDILIKVNKTKHLFVNWAIFASLTFQSLVKDPQLHDNIKKMINNLLAPIKNSSKGSLDSRESRIIDQLATDLENYSPSFFSAGDKYSYRANKGFDALASRLSNSLLLNSKEIEDEAITYIEFLMNSSKYWTSKQHVFFDAGTGNQDDISELSKSCELLSKVGLIGLHGIIDLCLATAENFGGNRRQTFLKFNNIGLIQDSDSSMLNNSRLSEPEKKSCKEECYKILIKYLHESCQHLEYINNNEGSGYLRPKINISQVNSTQSTLREMISKVWKLCDDPSFRVLLLDFSHKLALQHGIRDFLIQDKVADEYLRKKDKGMYYQNLRHNKNFHEAALFQHENAMCDDEIKISQRILFLEEAERDAKDSEVINGSKGGTVSIQSQNFRKELHYLLKIAEIQKETKIMYENKLKEHFKDIHDKQIEYFTKIIGELEYKVFDANYLFSVAMKEFGGKEFYMSSLWHVAIHIILLTNNSVDASDAIEHILKHKTNTTPKEMLKKLIRSYILNKVPFISRTNNNSINQFFKESQKNIFIDNLNIINKIYFEDYDHWWPNLKDALKKLHKQVHDENDDNIVLPYRLILEEISNITIHLKQLESPDNIDSITKLRDDPFKILREIGVKNEKLITYYYSIFSEWVNDTKQHGEFKCVHICRSAISCFHNWKYQLEKYKKENKREDKIDKKLFIDEYTRLKDPQIKIINFSRKINDFESSKMKELIDEMDQYEMNN